MSSPAARFAREQERLDRRLGFALGAVVGLTVGFFGVAGDADATFGRSLVGGGVVAVVLGLAVALFGDRALAWFLRWI